MWDIGICRQVLCGLKLLLLVLLELASDATLFSVLATRPPAAAAAGDVEGQEPELKDGLYVTSSSLERRHLSTS